MKRCFLLGLATLGLFAFTPSNPKQMTDSEFTLIRATNNTDPITMGMTATATNATRTNIVGTNGSSGTGTIIGTIIIGTTTGTDAAVFSPDHRLAQRYGMKSLLSVLALAIGALAFQSCEVYPKGTSRGYSGGGYYGGGYYGGGGYGSTVVVSSGDREHHHGYGYSNGYYERENVHVNRNVNGNRNVNVNRNLQVNRNAHANRSAHVNRNVHINRNVHHQ